MSERTTMTQPGICSECDALLDHDGEYHPYAFCVLRKAGANPLDVVTEAIKALAPGGSHWKLVRDPPTDSASPNTDETPE